MFNSCKTKTQQGNIGLGRAIAYFTSQNQTVSIPLNDSQDYDLIVEENKQLKKVQVKTTNTKSNCGIYKVSLRTCGGNQSFHTVKHFDPAKVDYLFVLTSEGYTYCIPCDQIHSKSQLNLGHDKEIYRV